MVKREKNTVHWSEKEKKHSALVKNEKNHSGQCILILRTLKKVYKYCDEDNFYFL